MWTNYTRSGWLGIATFAFFNLIVASTNAVGANITTKIIEDWTLEIIMDGEITAQDAEKFESAIDDALKKKFKAENPDYEEIQLDHIDISQFSEINLSLNSKGGDLSEALKIIRIIKENNIRTYVRRDAACRSACAFIFLAGSIQWPYEDPLPSRTLEAGGILAFHAPYSIGPGTFRSGRQVMTDLINELGDYLPGDMFKEIMTKKPNEYLTIDTIEQAAKWKIDLDYYKDPWPNRVGFVNACRNFLRYVRKIPAYSATYADSSVLVEGGEILPPDNEESLADRREHFKAPNLLRLRWLKGGSATSQVAFDHYDELGRFWCTVWMNKSRNLFAIDEKIIITDQNYNAGIPHSQPLPTWYQYTPSTMITDIAKPHETKIRRKTAN